MLSRCSAVLGTEASVGAYDLAPLRIDFGKDFTGRPEDEPEGESMVGTNAGASAESPDDPPPPPPDVDVRDALAARSSSSWMLSLFADEPGDGERLRAAALDVGEDDMARLIERVVRMMRGCGQERCAIMNLSLSPRGPTTKCTRNFGEDIVST